MTRVLVRSLRNLCHFVLGFGPTCRFAPCCSEYAERAVAEHGWARGTFYALRRLARCHPWGGQGWDPVPPRREPFEASLGHPLP